ncbi:MAG: FAD:protein FMN transferase [Pirellulales bacterium]|nr:FAD:protein FMN transferase [Pirellulales bacterium]
MGRIAIVWLWSVGILAAPADETKLQRFEFVRTEMAVPVKLVFYCIDRDTANRAAEAAYARAHQLNGILTDYDPDSELRRLCATAGEGKAVPVSEDLWRVLVRSKEISERSGGAFDVTVGPVVRLWRRARRQEEFPPADRLDEARRLVGYKLVRLDPAHRAVELLKPEMRLDLGGIAKGYVIDQLLAELGKHGIQRALVDAGGDVGLGDPPPDKPGWQIAVASLDPKEKPGRFLSLSNCGVATSGDTWQFVELNGRRYSHLIDPRTGIGLTDHSNVTAVAPDAMTADALASAVSVLGPEAGLRMVEEMPGAAALILRAPEGKLETYESCRWKKLSSAGPRLAR